MPEPDLALEVEHADHDFALGVVAGRGQRASVGQHGRAGHGHAQHAAVRLRGVLEREERIKVGMCTRVTGVQGYL